MSIIVYLIEKDNDSSLHWSQSMSNKTNLWFDYLHLQKLLPDLISESLNLTIVENLFILDG
jgi:hypothetical protein